MLPLSESELVGCIEAAIMAPSIHNTQPWLFVPRDDGIEVHADLSRQLAAIDPRHRMMYMSLGAAILNLRVALNRHGLHVRTDLLPDPHDLGHAATLVVDGRQPVQSEDVELFAAIPRRHTNREPYSDTPPSRADLQRLITAAQAEDCLLTIAEPTERDALLGLVRTADTRLREDRSYRSELRSWTTDDPYRDDGIPIEAVGPWSLMEAVPIRDLAPEREIPDRQAVPFEREPTIATIAGYGEEGLEQCLRGGQAMERVLLEATSLGLATSLFTQPLDVPDLRDLLTDVKHFASVLVILRLGYGPAVAGTPRRPATDVIVRDQPGVSRSRLTG